MSSRNYSKLDLCIEKFLLFYFGENELSLNGAILFCQKSFSELFFFFFINVVLMFLLLTLNRFHLLFLVFPLLSLKKENQIAMMSAPVKVILVSIAIVRQGLTIARIWRAQSLLR